MRKEYLRGLFNRTPNQIAEEEALYVEVKRLEANESRWKKDRDELLRTLAGIESGLPNLNANWDVQNGVPQMFSDRDRKNLNKRRDGGIDTTFLGLGGSASLLPKRDRVYGQCIFLQRINHKMLTTICSFRLQMRRTASLAWTPPIHQTNQALSLYTFGLPEYPSLKHISTLKSPPSSPKMESLSLVLSCLHVPTSNGWRICKLLPQAYSK